MFLKHRKEVRFSIRFSSFLLERNGERLRKFEVIEISSKVVEVTVNNKEENSYNFCLDFVQEFGLRKANVLPASFGDDHFSADTAKLGPQIPIFQRHLHKTTGKFKIYIINNMFAIFGSKYRLEVMWSEKPSIATAYMYLVYNRAEPSFIIFNYLEV
jgi:hypothetical protein